MKMKLSTVELVILGLSTILQLVCLVAPGWWIQTSKDSGYTTYAAIFYRIDCEKSHCETMSWRAYIDKSDSVAYDVRVALQIFFIFAMVATVVCLALHIVRRRRQIMSSLLIVIMTCSCMVGSGALMIWNLSIYYILLHSIQEYDPDTYGFPYCILLYSMAFFANVTVFILFVIEAVREHRRQISHDKHILSEPGGQLQHTL